MNFLPPESLPAPPARFAIALEVLGAYRGELERALNLRVWEERADVDLRIVVDELRVTIAVASKSLRAARRLNGADGLFLVR